MTLWRVCVPALRMNVVPVGLAFTADWMLCPGNTATPTTGAAVDTVSAAEPVLPSLVATIVATPGAAAVTSPEEETLATPELEELHTMVRPVKTLPDASRSVAVACAVCGTVRVEEFNDTLTVATAPGAAGGAAVRPRNPPHCPTSGSGRRSNSTA